MARLVTGALAHVQGKQARETKCTERAERARRDLAHWRRVAKLPEVRKLRKESVPGAMLAARAEAGGLSRYHLGTAERVLCNRHGRRVTELMGWLVAAARVTKRMGARLAHAHVARILGCSERTAGATMRKAVAAGLVYRIPWFVSGAIHGRKHDQRDCLYQLSDDFLAFCESAQIRGFTRRLLAGKICQPREFSSLTGAKKVSPTGTNRSGRPAEAVDNSKASSRAASAAASAAGRLPREAEQRLVRLPEQVIMAPDEGLARSLNAAWAAWEARHS